MNGHIFEYNFEPYFALDLSQLEWKSRKSRKDSEWNRRYNHFNKYSFDSSNIRIYVRLLRYFSSSSNNSNYSTNIPSFRNTARIFLLFDYNFEPYWSRVAYRVKIGKILNTILINITRVGTKQIGKFNIHYTEFRLM